MNDDKIKDFLKSHKPDVPDNGFSKQIMNSLPERNNILRQVIILLFAFLGIGLAVGIYGMTLLLQEINDFITSIASFQIPSGSSMLAYMLVISSISMIGFTIYQSESM